MEDNKRKFKFYMTDEMGNEFSFEESVDEDDTRNELDFILNEFKNFLMACGWYDSQVSQIQYLEDDEWKYVLEQYDEWNPYYEQIYQIRKGRN